MRTVIVTQLHRLCLDVPLAVAAGDFVEFFIVKIAGHAVSVKTTA